MRIVDTSTPVPGTTAGFQRFDAPAISNGLVGVAGYHDLPLPTTAGIYTGSGGPLTTVADFTTPIPGGTGNFTGFAAFENDGPSLSAGAAAFLGDGFGTSFIQRGIYLREGGSLSRVVDRNTPVPNGTGGNFFTIRQPALENGRVAFVGHEFGGAQRGVYSWQSGSLSVIADRNTPIPKGPGTFTDVFDCDLDQGQVIFTAEGQGLHRGLYRSDAGGLTRLYDTTMVAPGGNGTNFTFLAQAVLSAGHVAFWAAGGGTEGVYTDVSGQLQVLANRNTPPPGVSWAAFGGFSTVAIDGNVVAFDAISGGGAFSGVFSTHTGILDNVIASGDLLDGRVVADAGIGAQALDGSSLAIWVSFTNGTQGIYMATIPAPGVLALLGLAGFFAARRRR